MLFPLFFAAVYLSHITLLRLPYFWDEAGYYIPAAWDFFRLGTLIPQTTITNAHPPLPSILLAAWWHLSGFVISGTRTFVCIVAAGALLGVFRLTRILLSNPAAIAVTLLTAIYPIWFAQSTLAHADIFAAAFTLWALSFYLEQLNADHQGGSNRRAIFCSVLFSLAALSKETAIVTPAALAAWETWQWFRNRNKPASNSLNPARLDAAPLNLTWIAALAAPVLPLAAWYAYHRHKTGFVFGNPEFLRYNATANLDAHRILLCLWHRILHLTTHMNMIVPVLCTLAILWTMPLTTPVRRTIKKRVFTVILVVITVNLVAFSVLGGALLTRYLLPLYPLVLLLCVNEWRRKLHQWWYLAALAGIAFACGIWINPPYAFAPEDNLTYRDMIVLHQQAISLIQRQFPDATVLSAWPGTAELNRPELGYVTAPIQTVAIQNFSYQQVAAAATSPSNYDTAFIFSTKWSPPYLNLGKPNENNDIRYFDFHRDLSGHEVAALLRGDIIWQSSKGGEWAAVIRFQRVVDARSRAIDALY